MAGVKTMTKLSERLTNLRESKGWNKTHTARKLGIKTVSTYANWEYGTREPDAEMLAKIADLFEVTTDYLIGRSDTKDYTQKDEEAFLRFKDDPALQRWFYDLPKSEEEDIRQLKKVWDIIKHNHEK